MYQIIILADAQPTDYHIIRLPLTENYQEPRANRINEEGKKTATVTPLNLTWVQQCIGYNTYTVYTHRLSDEIAD
ncbi:hypothetical protein J6590_104259, partial [Homalodisca vitripennis]